MLAVFDPRKQFGGVSLALSGYVFTPGTRGPVSQAWGSVPRSRVLKCRSGSTWFKKVSWTMSPTRARNVGPALGPCIFQQRVEPGNRLEELRAEPPRLLRKNGE